MICAMALAVFPSIIWAGCADDANVCRQAVFCSGFEEGNKSAWDDYDGNPDSTNLIVEEPGYCNTRGNHVMRIRVPPGEGGADLVKVLPSSHDKLYARWYQKWEQGYDFSAPNHGSGLHAGDRNLLGRSGHRPSGSDWFSSLIQPAGNGGPHTNRLMLYSYYRGMYQDCGDPNGQCWGDALPCMWDEGSNYCKKPEHRESKLPPPLETEKWYCIEVMLDAGAPSSNGATASGAQNFWLDGVEYGPWENLWHRTSSQIKPNILWLSLYHHGNHSSAGIMLDNVVVADKRIGCAENSQIPPNPPSNLKVN